MFAVMITIRRTLPAATAVALLLAACGGSSDGDADDTVPPATAADTVAEETEDFTEAEPADTEAPAEEPEEEAPVETEAAAPADTEPAEEPEGEEGEEGESDVGEAAAAVDVALTEWSVNAPSEYSAGEVTFNATNSGSFPHEFVVIAGESYEALPLAEGGAVVEDDLPTGALIGRTGRLGGGESEALTVTLAPGNYVLVCNLGGGSNSHAGQGQRLDITVS